MTQEEGVYCDTREVKCHCGCVVGFSLIICRVRLTRFPGSESNLSQWEGGEMNRPALIPEALRASPAKNQIVGSGSSGEAGGVRAVQSSNGGVGRRTPPSKYLKRRQLRILQRNHLQSPVASGFS